MDDYISRQDAINALENTDCELLPEEWDMLTDSIMCIPAAPVREVKRGKWIDNKNGTWSCSLCQSWIPDEQHYYAHYCLYCGADMRVVEEYGPWI